MFVRIHSRLDKEIDIDRAFESFHHDLAVDYKVYEQHQQRARCLFA
jgi:hypothetical protein